MEQKSAYGSTSRRRSSEELDLNLREWSLRPQLITSSDHTTKSRRFSGSHIRSFREDFNATSFRSCITISSTASSPGYPFKEEIDPSTYSFTTALKALQARAGNNYKWETFSSAAADGFALNSKWNEAEKYISNPLSGQVPLECLSAKTLLSGRSFRYSSNTATITMSAPLVYSSNHHFNNPIFTSNPSSSHPSQIIHFPLQEKRMESMMTMTRDIGTQSTPLEEANLSRGSPLIKTSNFPISDNINFKPQQKVDEEKETSEEEEEERKKKEKGEMWKCKIRSSMQGGCLSWIRRRHTTHHKHRPKSTHNNFLLPNYLRGC